MRKNLLFQKLFDCVFTAEFTKFFRKVNKGLYVGRTIIFFKKS